MEKQQQKTQTPVGNRSDQYPHLYMMSQRMEKENDFELWKRTSEFVPQLSPYFGLVIWAKDLLSLGCLICKMNSLSPWVDPRVGVWTCLQKDSVEHSLMFLRALPSDRLCWKHPRDMVNSDSWLSHLIFSVGISGAQESPLFQEHWVIGIHMRAQEVHLWVHACSSCVRVGEEGDSTLLQLSLPVYTVRSRHSTPKVKELLTPLCPQQEKWPQDRTMGGLALNLERYDIKPRLYPLPHWARRAFFPCPTQTPTHPFKPKSQSPPF